MFSIDKYLDKTYHFTKYNCGHFVNEVWMDLTGECIIGICQSFVQGEDGDFTMRIRERTKLKEPETPCVAMMHSQDAIPHAGIYIDGSILHLTESGVQFIKVERLAAFCKMSYYK